MKSRLPLPISSFSAIRKLGMDLCLARRRRRISTKLMAERMGCTVNTLRKIEKGDSNTSLGNYARAIFVLGLNDRLRNLAEPSIDEIAFAVDEEHLPKRIHYPKKRRI